MSKRDETLIQFISDYRKRGYLPEAIFNFLSLLGWSPRTEEEIFSKAEMIEIFNLQNFSNAPSKFNLEKLKWTNNYYLQKLSLENAYIFLTPFIPEELFKSYRKENILLILSLFIPQIHEGIEIKELSTIFIKKTQPSEEFKTKLAELNVNFSTIIETFKNDIEKVNWSKQDISKLISDLANKLSIKGKALFMPLRFQIFGVEHGPGLADSLYILGKEEVLKRLKI